MDDKILMEKIFARIINDISAKIRDGGDFQYADIVFANDKMDTGLSRSINALENFRKYLLLPDKNKVTALAMTDAVFAFEANEDDLSKGLFVPGEGDMEPLAIAFVCSDIKELYPDSDVLAFLFSCIPDKTEIRNGFLFRLEKDSGDIMIKKTTIPENAEAVWRGWMRIMWGMNWQVRYGN